MQPVDHRDHGVSQVARGSKSSRTWANMVGAAEAVRSRPRRWLPLILVAIFCGLRISELRGLRWIDVDHDKSGMLEVKQRADASHTIGRLKSKSGYRSTRGSGGYQGFAGVEAGLPQR